jgi:hypothetical protein
MSTKGNDKNVVDFSEFFALASAATEKREQARVAFDQLLATMNMNIAGLKSLPHPICVPLLDCEPGLDDMKQRTRRTIGLVLGTHSSDTTSAVTEFWLTQGRHRLTHPTAIEEALLPFKTLNVSLPRPEDYPVLWAIRDFHMIDEVIWPTLNQIIDCIFEQPWASGKMRSREFIMKAVERLKAGYVNVDSRQGQCMITNRSDEQSALRRRLVLLDTTPKIETNLTPKVTRKFLERYVRENMPLALAFIPEHADTVPDGIILRRKSDDQWDYDNPVAVETHTSHHPSRAGEQALKRFAQGYAKVIVVCVRHDDEVVVTRAALNHSELKQRVQDGQLEITTLPAVVPRDSSEFIQVGDDSASGDPVHIAIEELGAHALFLGQAGTGKTNLVVKLLLQVAKRMEEDRIRACIWVIDPVGRLWDLWITRAPEGAKNRTILFEPEREPWGMNPLALPPTDNAREYLLMAKEKTGSVTRMIKQSPRAEIGWTQWDHRRIVRLILMSLYNRGLQNPALRSVTFKDVLKVVHTIGDEERLTELVDEMGLDKNLITALGNYDREARNTLVHLLAPFVDPSISNFTCAEQSVNFQDMDRPGNIIFFTFKGLMHLPDDVSTLVESTILNIYSAELARKQMLRLEDAHQTYLVVDEAHRTVDTLSLRDLLATARNIKLSVWLVYHGATAMEDETLHDEVFNNAHTKFIFTVGGSLAAELQNDLDIALGKKMAQRLRTLESFRCYLLRAGDSPITLSAPPEPTLLVITPLSKVTRTLEQAYELFNEGEYKPHDLDRDALKLFKKLGARHIEIIESSPNETLYKVVMYDEKGTLVKVEHRDPGNKVASRQVEDFTHLVKEHDADDGIYVTNSSFTKDCKDSETVKLVDREKLANILKQTEHLEPTQSDNADDYTWNDTHRSYQPSLMEITAIIPQIPQAIRQMTTELERLKEKAQQALSKTTEMTDRLKRQL